MNGFFGKLVIGFCMTQAQVKIFCAELIIFFAAITRCHGKIRL